MTGTPADLLRGSEWREWDLHVHSPLSALNNQFPKHSNGEPEWDAYISALEALSGVSVLGITDYFTIEGYRKVLEYREQGRLANVSLVLPNIEFRLDKVVGTSHGQRRLNYHVIFSDALTPDQIEEHFLKELKFCFQSDPQRTDLNLSVTRQNLELLGSQLKKEHPHFNDSRSAFEIGCMNATVNPTQLKEVLRNKGLIFRGKFLVVLADERLSLMNWNSQDHQTRKVLLQGADAIFTANPKTILWARGERDLNPEGFRREFKSLKPSLHGSDAHSLDQIGRPDLDRACWVKSDLTFEGLKQVLYEPRDRVFIGDRPPLLKHDYQVIDSVTVTGAESWFAPEEMPLNHDLVAIIGPRGSGKSALAEMLAIAGGSAVFRAPRNEDLEDSFLFKASKRSAANQNPITGARLLLKWASGEKDEVTITSGLDHGTDEEKVKYLPQRFVERLCAPENTRQLENEIERVIFQRIENADRLGASNFLELRSASTRSIELKRQKLASTIRSLNQSIDETSRKIGLKQPKAVELQRKRDELKLLLKKAPEVPPENQKELELLESLTKRKENLESEIVRNSEKLNALDAIQTKYQLLAEELAGFNKEIAELLEKAGVTPNDSVFRVSVPEGFRDVLASRRSEITTAVGTLRHGVAGDTPVEGLDQVNAQIAEAKAKSQLAETRRKEHEKFQRDRKALETAIDSLEKEIKEIDEVLKPLANGESDTRLERYLDGFQLLHEEKQVLDSLYEPLRKALEASNEIARKLTFVSKVTLDVSNYATRGIELFDRRKAVFKDVEDLEQRLKRFMAEVLAAELNREQLRQAVNELRESFLTLGEQKIGLREQLRSGRTTRDFADWLYSLAPFSVTYSIKFDDKDLHLLSPGEKGMVLLLLYLEAENEDNRPLIIDQPDDNLDNLSVYPSLVEYFRERKKTRQVFIITHNPNLVVNTDAEQVFVATFDGTRTPKLTYRSGALEDTRPTEAVPGIREEVCKILEGGSKAFRLREQRYSLP